MAYAQQLFFVYGLLTRTGVGDATGVGTRIHKGGHGYTDNGVRSAELVSGDESQLLVARFDAEFSL